MVQISESDWQQIKADKIEMVRLIKQAIAGVESVKQDIDDLILKTADPVTVTALVAMRAKIAKVY